MSLLQKIAKYTQQDLAVFDSKLPSSYDFIQNQQNIQNLLKYQPVSTLQTNLVQGSKKVEEDTELTINEKREVQRVIHQNPDGIGQIIAAAFAGTLGTLLLNTFRDNPTSLEQGLTVPGSALLGVSIYNYLMSPREERIYKLY